MECAQINISGGTGTASPATVAFPGTYSVRSPRPNIQQQQLTYGDTGKRPRNPHQHLLPSHNILRHPRPSTSHPLSFSSTLCSSLPISLPYTSYLFLTPLPQTAPLHLRQRQRQSTHHSSRTNHPTHQHHPRHLHPHHIRSSYHFFCKYWHWCCALWTVWWYWVGGAEDVRDR